MTISISIFKVETHSIIAHTHLYSPYYCKCRQLLQVEREIHPEISFEEGCDCDWGKQRNINIKWTSDLNLSFQGSVSWVSFVIKWKTGHKKYGKGKNTFRNNVIFIMLKERMFCRTLNLHNLSSLWAAAKSFEHDINILSLRFDKLNLWANSFLFTHPTDTEPRHRPTGVMFHVSTWWMSSSLCCSTASRGKRLLTSLYVSLRLFTSLNVS